MARQFHSLAIISGLAAVGLCNSRTADPQVQARIDDHAIAIVKPAPLYEDSGAIVPFHYDPPVRPFLTVQARIGDSEPLSFVVDTGSEFDVLLAPWAEARLGLKADSETFRIAPGDLKGHIVSSVKLTFVTQNGSRPKTVLPRQIGVIDLPVMRDAYGPGIAGVLGGELLSGDVSRYDFDNKTLTFLSSLREPIAPTENGVALPLVTEALELRRRPRIAVRLSSGDPVHFVVDTGVNITCLPAERARAVDLASRGTGASGMDNGGQRATTLMLARRIMLDAKTVPLLPFMSVEGGSSNLLGLDFLSRFRISIDPRHNRLVLEARENAPLLIPGDPGIRCSVTMGKATVTELLDPGLRRTGIKVGDQILAVDGLPIADLPRFQISGMIGGNCETWMELSIQRQDGSRSKARLLRRSPYPGVIPSASGFVFARERSRKWRVLSVLDRTLAERAGIREADELLSLNGRLVREMDQSWIEDALAEIRTKGSRSVAMVLKHPGDGTEFTVSLP